MTVYFFSVHTITLKRHPFYPLLGESSICQSLDTPELIKKETIKDLEHYENTSYEGHGLRFRVLLTARRINTSNFDPYVCVYECTCGSVEHMKDRKCNPIFVDGSVLKFYNDLSLYLDFGIIVRWIDPKRDGEVGDFDGVGLCFTRVPF